MTLRGALRATLGAVLLTAAALPAYGAAPRALPPSTQFTPLTASTITRPAPFNASDGKVHLSYELFTTNALGRQTPVRIDSIEVQDARTKRVIGSLSGDALAAAANPIGVPLPGEGTDAARQVAVPVAVPVVASSEQWVIWLDLALDPAEAVPAELEHHLTGAVLAPSGPAAFEETVARTPLSRTAPLQLDSPVQPGSWYASESCCGNTHHRRGLAPINGGLYVPQRFAIDWFRVGDHNQTWEGDPSRLDSYLSFRQPVVAAARAKVVEVQDGLADNPPPVPPTVPPIQDTVGNHITLEVAPGQYLLYAHLEDGSLTVHEGDRVEPGQILGLIGNSGNSTTPHLHFQVMTTREFFPTDSPPYTFRSFDILGHVAPRIWDDNLGLRPTGVLPVDESPFAGPHTDELPLDRNVIRF
ncbi:MULTISPECIES: M23 family metallopeptidase [unclassified Kitasatospora]|uniref:M23 family metallopeptidase n=1 Tax=unclassified Kitasatospora TaxID=2633591 RepID=UPI002477097F|nr:M23 family metallopeptidase [Kitasatospora sp. MAP12-44]